MPKRRASDLARSRFLSPIATTSTSGHSRAAGRWCTSVTAPAPTIPTFTDSVFTTTPYVDPDAWIGLGSRQVAGCSHRGGKRPHDALGEGGVELVLPPIRIPPADESAAPGLCRREELETVFVLDSLHRTEVPAVYRGRKVLLAVGDPGEGGHAFKASAAIRDHVFVPHDHYPIAAPGALRPRQDLSIPARVIRIVRDELRSAVEVLLECAVFSVGELGERNVEIEVLQRDTVAFVLAEQDREHIG